jgi:hypothetical protein
MPGVTRHPTNHPGHGSPGEEGKKLASMMFLKSFYPLIEMISADLKKENNGMKNYIHRLHRLHRFKGKKTNENKKNIPLAIPVLHSLSYS